MSFLKAAWRKLAIANYKIDPTILQKYLPAGTEFDSWQGTHYVSLVAFMFLNTKMLGMTIPFHINFEEANLRFYVKRKEGKEWKRGVVFIKEIVPKFAISFVANTVYGEHYATHCMKHHWTEEEVKRVVSYEWKVKKEWQKISVEADLELAEIKEGSEEEFITEHYWGYSKINDRATTEYEVTHPKWQHYPVTNYEVQVDFGKNYGKEFQFLTNQAPLSVMLAEGSIITVESKKKLKIIT